MDNILIVDDDVSIVETFKFALKKKYNLFLAYNSKDALYYFINNDISVTILDLKLGNENGMDLYYEIKEINPNAVVIIITAFGTIKSSIEAIKSGIFNYLTKPINLKELEFIIAKGVEVNNLYKQLDTLEEETRGKYYEYGIISKSESMKNVLNTVEKIKNVDSNILLTGESGTGKGLLARTIHEMGNRRAERMNTVNCAAIPNELLESELFGYKKGAFTGAMKDKKGYFELSNRGTLFLDEIGDLDISLQGKLLHAIQEKKIIALGAEEEIDVDVRIITATNKDLFSLVNEGRFREDLYYRLNVININLPPLRERKEDIPFLVNHFIYKYSRILNKNIDKVEYDFIEALENYEFNGNIRELENLIERAIALSEGGVLTKKDILAHLNPDEKPNKIVGKKLIPVFIGDTLENIEKKVILSTFELCNHNQKQTAEMLGITDRTIRNKFKKYMEEKDIKNN
ncbi:sigma-54-dependent transcriptional regulator [Tissierella praeacuta]|uniref:sigma-54-dependent transcriptional regulator n=1 Tax=Tissierella praeacuta TaxID=43131 RepID=UPI0028B03805|nr:sigma-54 dependent transcriptional regulator [Tissierella praeacuta]